MARWLDELLMLRHGQSRSSAFQPENAPAGQPSTACSKLIDSGRETHLTVFVQGRQAVAAIRHLLVSVNKKHETVRDESRPGSGCEHREMQTFSS